MWANLRGADLRAADLPPRRMGGGAVMWDPKRRRNTLRVDRCKGPRLARRYPLHHRENCRRMRQEIYRLTGRRLTMAARGGGAS